MSGAKRHFGIKQDTQLCGDAARQHGACSCVKTELAVRENKYRYDHKAKNGIVNGV